MTTVRTPDLELGVERPRRLSGSASGADRIFRYGTSAVGLLVLILTGSIGIFLGYKLIPTIHRYGWKFFTEARFEPSLNIIGIASALLGSVIIAIITMVISFPIALATALYVSQYAPPWIKSFLVSIIDLMAAVPSIVYAAWGVFLVEPHALYFTRWLAEWFGWIPIFKVTDADPRAAAFQTAERYQQSAFMAGLIVAMMVIPLATAVMRNVFDQSPAGECEAAYALGATRWGMIRAVVLPFGRGGIIGGTMLGLGRALGETIVVLLVLSQNFDIKFRILEIGGVTISSLIANDFGEVTPGSQLSALLAAGFVLFLMTLVVNTLAAIVVNRSRSGSGVD